jgi:GNAT superfamily N-acetyltransferase
VEIRIRDRVAGDVPALLPVLDEVHRLDRYPLNRPADPVRWLVPPTAVRGWVAETAGGVVVGHVAVHEPAAVPGPLDVSRLLVSPGARGQDLGARLLDRARRWAAAHGRDLALDVVEDARSAPALALYERTGWHHAGTTTAPWTGPDESPVRLRHYLLPTRRIPGAATPGRP